MSARIAMIRFALAFTQMAVVLALFEGGARIAEWLHPPEPDLSFRYAPYRMLRMVKGPWPLNREGFRARELEQYRGTFLIEFLGGSVCVGVGTNPGETIPERLEAALVQSGLDRVSVLNLCQGGATSAQELAILEQYGLPLVPQVVISFDGANDLLHPQPVGDDEAPNLPYRNAEIRSRVNGDGEWPRHLAAVRIAARLAGHWREVRAADPGHNSVPTQAIVDSYLYTLGLTRTLVQSRGALYSVILQPTLHIAKPWSTEEVAMWQIRRPGDGAEISRISAERYQAASRQLAVWELQTRIPVFDLSRAFERVSANIYSDSVHFSGPMGYQMLFEDLRSEGLLETIAERYGRWSATHRAAASSANLRVMPAKRGRPWEARP